MWESHGAFLGYTPINTGVFIQELRNVVIANEAKQSSNLDRFVAALLARTLKSPIGEAKQSEQFLDRFVAALLAMTLRSPITVSRINSSTDTPS